MKEKVNPSYCLNCLKVFIIILLDECPGQEIVRQKPKYTVDHDGNFLFVIFIKPIDDAANFVAKVDVSMQGNYNWLSNYSFSESFF